MARGVETTTATARARRPKAFAIRWGVGAVGAAMLVVGTHDTDVGGGGSSSTRESAKT